MAERAHIADQHDARVRTRAVWGGTALGLVGIGAAGLGLSLASRWLGWGGALVAVVGLLAAWRGGIMHDTRGQEPPHHELREVVEGGGHRGVTPQARVVGAETQTRAARATERTERILARADAVPAPHLRRPAAFLLLVVGGWLFLSRWLLDYPFTVDGQNSALRETGFVVVVVLSALRLRPGTRSLVASALCLLSGAGLVATALLLPHDAYDVRVNELVTGVVVMGLASLTLT